MAVAVAVAGWPTSASAESDRRTVRPTADGTTSGTAGLGAARARTLVVGPRRAVLRFDLRRLPRAVVRARLVVRARGTASGLWAAPARVDAERIVRAGAGVRGEARRSGRVVFELNSRVRGGKRLVLLLYRPNGGTSVVSSRESGRRAGPRLELDLRRTPPAPSAPPPAQAGRPGDPAAPPAVPGTLPAASPGPTPGASPGPTSAASPVVAAAGDIAAGDPSRRGDEVTAELVARIAPDAVLALGDLAYPSGSLAQLRTFYEPSWGRFRAITKPVPGNHEYETPGAAGYFDYFNGVGVQTGPAADRAQGYYSFDLGDWHLVALNSNCAPVGGCHAGSPQEQWLRRDLAANARRCTLAYWHHPRFASGRYGDDPTYVPFWRALQEAGAEIVLNGHDHNYQRYARRDADGRADPARGVRAFVVGTGGVTHYPVAPHAAHREAANAGAHGVLKLTLAPTAYEWTFVGEPGSTFTDSGSADCHT